MNVVFSGEYYINHSARVEKIFYIIGFFYAKDEASVIYVCDDDCACLSTRFGNSNFVDFLSIFEGVDRGGKYEELWSSGNE